MEEILVILSSSWKFAATFPVAVFVFKMSFFETILYTNIGSLLGIVVFSILSKGILHLWDKYWPESWSRKKNSSRSFTKRNRRLVRLKNKFGLTGLVLLTPVLLSIPVGIFLNTKYYGRQKLSYFYLLAGHIGWSFIYTFFYIQLQQTVL